MSKYCICCGAPLPDGHKHKTCSMCYGDLDYGTDGYYRRYMEEWVRERMYEEDKDLSDL